MEKDVLIFLTILLPIIFLFSVFNASQKWIALSSVASLGIMIYTVFLGADYLIREEKFFHLLIKLLIISAILSAAYALIIHFREPDLRAEALFAGVVNGGGPWVGVLSLRIGLVVAGIVVAMTAGANPLALVIGLSLAMPAAVIAAVLNREEVIPQEADAGLGPDDPSWDSYSIWRATERDEETE